MMLYKEDKQEQNARDADDEDFKSPYVNMCP